MSARPFTSPIRVRMRPDLIVRQHQSDKSRAWIVKDPVSLHYFSLSAHEFAILQSLDGAKTFDDVCREFEAAFPPHRITPRHVQSYLATLYENGLVIADGADQGQLLLDSFERQRWRERWQTGLNWLAIRFRGIDPDPVLSWAYTKLRWIFSRWVAIGCILLALAAVAIVAAQAVEIRHQLPEIHRLVHPSNLIWLAIAFAAAKVLHEFGHALACKRYGGECHEMGVMLLLFVPCLYCNVTDSWMLQSRWQRIAVSAAGIVVELQLAAIAVICWWITQPGIVHDIALNTIVVCSISTLLFNGNPLLRYDGYFVLADLVEIPNLWQESRSAVRRKLAKWFLVPKAVAPTASEDRQALLTSYGVASIAYRVFVTLAILLFLYHLLVPKRLDVLILVVAASFVAAAALVWLGPLRRFWSKPSAWRQFRLGRIFLTLGALAGLAWLVLTVPIPCRIHAPALLQPLAAHRVYVSTPGELQDGSNPGTAVGAGEILARLEDLELHRDVLRLTGELQVAKTRVQNLQARLANDSDAAAQLEVAVAMLADVEQQLQQREKDEQALVLKSPVHGIVMEPPEVPNRPATDQRLPTWTGTPMADENSRCHLDRGSLYCLVGDPSSQEAVLFIDETDVQFVRLGQQVRMKFAVAPTAVLTGRIEEIAKRNLLTVPRELAVARELESRADSIDTQQPLRISYSVRVAIDEHTAHLLAGASGRAKILVESQTLAQRFVRVLRRTLTVDL